MDAYEMDTFNENYDIDNLMQEETSFFDNGFDELRNEEELDEFNNDNDYDENISDDIITKRGGGPYDETKWANKKWASKITNEEKKNIWKKAQKIKITNDRKTFFRNIFKQEVVMKDGPASKKLIEKTKISISEKTGKVNGLEYDDVKVVIKKGKNFIPSENERSKNTVEEFQKLKKQAQLEHGKTTNGSIEDLIGSLPGTKSVDDIRANAVDKIQDDIEIKSSLIDRTYLTEDELRELTGILKTERVENIEAVELAEKYWKNKAKEEKEVRRKVVLDDIAEVAKLKVVELKLKNNIKSLDEETLERLGNNELTRFQKFKKWAKAKFGVLSAVIISIGGALTAIITAAKKGLKSGAKMLGKTVDKVKKVVKTVKNAAEKGGEIAKGGAKIVEKVGSVLTTVLGAGVDWIGWLVKNMWFLAAALGFLVYKNRKAILA